MAEKIASLFAEIGADTSGLTSGLNKTKSELNDASGKMGAFGSAGKLAFAAVATAAAAATVVIAAIAVPVIKLGTDGLKAAADLEQSMADIRAVFSGAAPPVEELSELILALGIDPGLKVNATEAASAIELLARNGLTWEEIAGGAARSSILLSNATGGDFATSADIATDAMAIFNIRAKDMNRAVDGITSVTTNSKIGIEGYALGLAQAGGVASVVGVSFADFNTTLAGTAQNFSGGSDAGTSFKTFLGALIPKSEAASNSMYRLGIQTEEGGNQFFDAEGNMKSMADISGVLADALDGLSDKQKNAALKTIFGNDAMRTAAGLAKLGTDGFNELQDAMSKTDAAEKMAIRMDTLSGTLEIISGLMETTKVKIGNALLPAFRALAEFMLKFVSENESVMVGFFEKIGLWLSVKIPIAIILFKGSWATMQNRIATVSDFITETLIPTLKTTWLWVGFFLSQAATLTAGVWTNILQPGIEKVGDYLSGAFTTIYEAALTMLGIDTETSVLTAREAFFKYLPTMETTSDFIRTNLIITLQNLIKWVGVKTGAAITAAKGYWENTFKPALMAVNLYVTETVVPKFREMLLWVDEKAGAAIASAKGYWENTLKPAMKVAGDYVNDTLIPKFNELVAWVDEKAGAAIASAKGYWENTLKPAMKVAGDYVNDTLVPKYTELIDWVGTKTSEATAAAKGYWETTLQPALATVSDYIVSNVTPNFLLVSTWLSETLAAVVPAAKTLLEETLKPGFVTVADYLVGTFIDALVKISEWLGVTLPESITTAEGGLKDQLLKGITNVADFITGTATKALTDFTGIISDDSPKAFTIFSDAVNEDMIPPLEDVGKVLNDDVNPPLNDFVKTLEERMPAAAKVARLSFLGVSATGESFRKVMVNQVGPDVETTLSNLTELTRDFRVDWGLSWAGVKTAVANTIGFYVTKALSMVAVTAGVATGTSASVANITGSWVDLQEGTTTTWDGITQMITGSAKTISAAMEGDMTGVIEGLGLQWEGLRRATSGAWISIKAIIRASIGTILIAIGGFTAGFLGFFGNLEEQLLGKEAGTGVINGIVQGIETAIADGILGWEESGELIIDGIIKGISGKIVDIAFVMRDAAKTAENTILDYDWAASGKAIIDGIKAGFNAAKQALLDAVQSLVDSIKSKIKGAFNIGSPSKWMAKEVGVPLVQGIIMGMDQERGNLGSHVQAIAGDVKTAARKFIVFDAFNTASEKGTFAESFISGLEDKGTSQLKKIKEAVDFLRLHGTNVSQELIGGVLDPTGSEFTGRLRSLLQGVIGETNKQLKTGIQAAVFYQGFIDEIEKQVPRLEKVVGDFSAVPASLKDEVFGDLIDRIQQSENFFDVQVSQILQGGSGSRRNLEVNTANRKALMDELIAKQTMLNKLTADAEGGQRQLADLKARNKLVNDVLKNGLSLSEIFGTPLHAPGSGLNLDPLGFFKAQIKFNQALIEQEKERLSLTSQRIDALAQEKVIQEEQAAIEARKAALNAEENRLGFLRDQQNLLKDISENELNLEAILDGFQIGVNASQEDFIDVMRRFTTAMIAVTEAELGIASPSKVFEGIGRNLMAGLSRGIEGSMKASQRVMAGAVEFGSGLAAQQRIVNNNFTQVIHSQSAVDQTVQNFNLMQSIARS